MFNNIKNIVIVILSVAVVLLSIKSCKQTETITVDVPVKIEVPVPVVKKHFDTIYLPSEIKTVKTPVIDSLYYDKYLALVDSLAKDELIKDILTVREYNEVFEDSIQTVQVYSNVTGKLNKQTLKYETKERFIPLDTTITTTIDIPYRTKLALGLEVGIPLSGAKEIYYNPTTPVVLDQELLFKANLYIDTKKMIYNLGVDNEKQLWLGGAYKF